MQGCPSRELRLRPPLMLGRCALIRLDDPGPRGRLIRPQGRTGHTRIRLYPEGGGTGVRGASAIAPGGLKGEGTNGRPNGASRSD